jgi:hypothetical protein
MERRFEQLRLFSRWPDEIQLTGAALAQVLAWEGINTSAMTRFCTSPDGTQFVVPIPQSTAWVVWRRLRELVPETGYWPVLTLGYAAMAWTDDEIGAVAEELAARSAEAVVAEALKLDVQDWLARRKAIYTMDDNDSEDPGAIEELAGAWPDDALPRTDFWILDTPIGSGMLDLRLVPTTVAWQSPAFFTYGGSSGLEPSEHVAVLWDWQRRYGAEVVSIAGDIIELAVEQPPQDRESAWALAWEHFAYCPDVVVQGTQTVGHLAALLLGGTAWYFWWD